MMKSRPVVVALAVVGMILSLIAPSVGADPNVGGADSLEEITSSDRFRFSHAQVLRLYQAYFVREPDLAGAKYWVEVNNAGSTPEQISDFFAASTEFNIRYGELTDDEFIRRVYRNVLARQPDPEGFAYWQQLLSTGEISRGSLMLYFSLGHEFADAHRFPNEPGPLNPFTFGFGEGEVTPFTVGVEPATGLPIDETVLEVQSILADYRSWISGVDVRFRRTDLPGPDTLQILVATPATVDRNCAPLRTNGRFSCRKGNNVYINLNRWTSATDAWTASLAEYRAYVINHEVGHFLGFGHVSCPGAGQPAPVMQQQTKSLQGCAPNGWPHP